jgi:group I intron endonuclease
MKISGIYQIQSKIKPERIYIGSAMNIRHRWECHLSDLRLNKHHSPQLQRHFNKYGEFDLTFTIIEPCLPQFLTIRENTYFNPLPYFNCAPIAGSSLGIKRSDEYKQKIRLANLGKKQSEETKEKKRILQTGVKQSQSVIDKKKKAMLGHVVSESTRSKISESLKGSIPWNKGIPSDDKTRDMLRNLRIGKTHSEETKQKMSLSHKGQGLGLHLSQEHKKKLSEAHKGKPSPLKGQSLSESTRKKMSEALKGRVVWNKGLKLNKKQHD